MIKIISGKYKNRFIPIVKGADFRPTTSRLREAIFSTLTSNKFNLKIFENIEVLDLFAGSGALSFEALSRGAQSATLIDINNQNLVNAKNFAKKIGIEDNISFLNLNALNLPQAYKKFDLIFIDPPYKQNLINKILENLLTKNWISSNSILVLELLKTTEIIYPNNMIELFNRHYGKSKLLVLKVL